MEGLVVPWLSSNLAPRTHHRHQTVPALLHTQAANALRLARFMIGTAKAAAGPVRFPPTLMFIQEPAAQDMRQDRVAVIAAPALKRTPVLTRSTVIGMITYAIVLTITCLVVPAVAVSHLTPLAPILLSVVTPERAIQQRRDVCQRQRQRRLQRQSRRRNPVNGRLSKIRGSKGMTVLFVTIQSITIATGP